MYKFLSLQLLNREGEISNQNGGKTDTQTNRHSEFVVSGSAYTPKKSVEHSPGRVSVSTSFAQSCHFLSLNLCHVIEIHILSVSVSFMSFILRFFSLTVCLVFEAQTFSF